jgi:hypothetical protein
VVDTLGAGDGFIAACLLAIPRRSRHRRRPDGGCAEQAAQVCGYQGGFGHGVAWTGLPGRAVNLRRKTEMAGGSGSIRGTFTDVCLFDDATGMQVAVWKVPSTPDDPSRAIARGTQEGVERVGASPATSPISAMAPRSAPMR